MKISAEIPENLPPQVAALLAELQMKYQKAQEAINEKEKIILNKDMQIKMLECRLTLALQARYASRSEKCSKKGEGLLLKLLFDEPEELPAVEIQEIEKAEEEITVTSYKRKKSGRRALPAHLPRVQHIHDLSEAEKICHCGHELKCIGSEKSEQLEIIPAKMQVIENIRLKYACKICEETIKTAALPLQVMPKSIATPGLLAHVLVSKYCDHLPLYRQEKIMKRIGVDLRRMTLCHWVIKCGELLSPLIALMRNHIVSYDVAYADETTVQVLDEENRRPQQMSYMWLYMGGTKEKRCTVYEYQPTRCGEHAKKFLENFKGYLHVDGYAGYERLFENKAKGVGCMAHARRKFFELIKLNKHDGLAAFAVKHIAKLYRIEEEAKQQQLTPEQIKELRQTKSKPLLEEFKKWLDENIRKVPPQNPLAKAINYSLNRWTLLMRYCDDGRLEIDNNRAERAIKPFAISRNYAEFNIMLS